MTPLELLRQYCSEEKEIILDTETGEFVFGDTRIPRKSETEWRRLNPTGRPYALESLWLAYEYRDRQGVYLTATVKMGIQAVAKKDREPLIQYLKGAISGHENIVPLDLPEKVEEQEQEKEVPAQKASQEPAEAEASSVTHISDALKSARARIAMIKEREKQTEEKKKEGRRDSKAHGQIAQKSEKMEIETTESAIVEQVEPVQKRRRVAAAESLAIITKKERKLRTRTSVLQNSKKNFASLVGPVQRLLKEDRAGDAHAHGSGSSRRKSGHGDARSSSSSSSRRSSGVGSSSLSHSISISRTSSRHTHSQGQIPIIIVPSTRMSTLSIYNAKPLFELGVFMTMEEAAAKPNASITSEEAANGFHVTRTRNGNSMKYLVVCNTRRFTDKDWDRVVAVFASGKTWQFKGWKYDEPVDLFERSLGCHARFEDEALDQTISKWNVRVYVFNKTKRHLDSQILYRFWADLDAFVARVKPHLRS